MELNRPLIDRFIDATLRAYEEGGLSLQEATRLIGQAFALAAANDKKLDQFLRNHLDS